jgi:hypothetical protein
MEFVMVAIWYLSAAAVFAAGSIVYGSTFFDFNLLERVPQLWPLHALAIGVFLTALASMAPNIPDPKDVDAWMKRNAPWLRRLGLALFLNAMACLVLDLVVGRGGWPEKRGDKFVAAERGTVVRELTEEQYRTLRGCAIRFFPSFWMVFSGYPALIAIAKSRAPSDDPFPVRRPSLLNGRN